MSASGRCCSDAPKFNRHEWEPEQTNLLGRSIRQTRDPSGRSLSRLQRLFYSKHKTD